MRELLKLAPKPARYAGTEWGAVQKDPGTVSARLALAFPDLYEVGMSYLGQRILYEAVNATPEFWAERVFAPCEETAALMRQRGAPLCSLESDTPLARLDAVAFHLTHELCFTNVLFMLDLAGIPRRSAERDARHPLILAGGGCAFNAEPLAPFLDVMVLGDGEEVLPAILRVLAQAKKEGLDRPGLLRRLADLPGVYAPAFFRERGEGLVEPIFPDLAVVEKALIPDLDAAPFPANHVLPFGKAVHDRLAVEIARGCTRGCRFCHAGMIYRPARERSLEVIDDLVCRGLRRTGYEELSFLSLSTGDFSALESLFERSVDRCRRDQVAVSLPSLRAGTLSDSVLSAMAGIRRTGATMAPEAATQRLRDVINKGISEEDVLEHARRLFVRGWQSVKLYFMIGLPTETMDDVRAIFELAKKVLEQAGPKVKRLQVTASISPFVPKPHTPFQWERQLGLAEVRERVGLLRELFSRHKKLVLRWHEPEMSWLEGVFSRGDRRLAPVVEKACDKGALFTAWVDRFKLAPWLDALSECGLSGDDFLASREVGGPLPWDHLSCGVSPAYLVRERERAFAGKITPDCRFGACVNCGVCNFEGRKSLLRRQADKEVRPRLNAAAREAHGQGPEGEAPREDLARKAGHYRVWYAKKGPASLLSQLEMGALLERAFRRAGLKPAFSSGFHPQPLMTFGWALPVGVESEAEWFALYLREALSPEEVAARLGPMLPVGLDLVTVEALGPQRRVPQPEAEEFLLRVTAGPEVVASVRAAFAAFLEKERVPHFLMTKKGGRGLDLRPLVLSAEPEAEDALRLVLSWKETYLNPLKLVAAVCQGLAPEAFALTKTRQIFAEKDGPA